MILHWRRVMCCLNFEYNYKSTVMMQHGQTYMEIDLVYDRE